MRPIELIGAIRNSFKQSVNVYTEGGCYQFYKILKVAFPQAKAYYDSDHVITEIDGKFYDITGIVEKKTHLPVDGNFDHEELNELTYCNHPLDKRYFSNGGGKCLKCGKIL